MIQIFTHKLQKFLIRFLQPNLAKQLFGLAVLKRKEKPMFARKKYKSTIQGVWKKCALSKLIVSIKKVNKNTWF